MVTSEAPTLSDEQLGEVLGLAADADSVELKLTIPNAEHRSTVQKLGIDPLDAQLRQVFFFDTPDLALNQHGIVARARRIQGRGDDSVVKLRPVVPGELSKKLRRSSNFVVEVDALPGGYVCSASMKRPAKPLDVRGVAAGSRRVSKLFSKEQRAFFSAHAPSGLALDNLSVLGPILVMKVRFNPREFGRKLVAELWFYPDYSAILEVSTKAAPGDGLRVAGEARAFLAKRGVDLGGEQQTKTKTALEFFAGAMSQ
jgi:hypothetical protein